MILGDLHLVRAQILADDDGGGGAHGEEEYAEEVEHGGADAGCRHHVQAAQRVDLVQRGHAQRPEQLVHQQRHALDGDLLHHLAGNGQRAEEPLGEGVLFGVAVGVDHDDAQLHIAGQHGGDGCALHAQLREAQLAVDQQVVENEVDEHGDDARQHGQAGLAGLTQGAGVALGDGEGRKSQQHEVQVLQAVVQRIRHAGRVAVVGEVQQHQLPSLQQEQRNRAHGQQQARVELVAAGRAHALLVARAAVLGGEDARARNRAEYGQVEYIDQLVCHGDARKLVGADAADHQVVQQVDEVRDGILHDDRNHHGQNHCIERAASDQLAKLRGHSTNTSIGDPLYPITSAPTGQGCSGKVREKGGERAPSAQLIKSHSCNGT